MAANKTKPPSIICAFDADRLAWWTRKSKPEEHLTLLLADDANYWKRAWGKDVPDAPVRPS